MSKNAEGWIRHRGGKCPVDKGVRVDVHYRDGEISMNQPALEKGDPSEPWAEDWSHDNCAADIMAYRLHKPAEQVEACSKPDPRDSAKRDSDYVCWMRDRITEIDSTTSALAAERAELVQKLASEGFALIGRINDLLTYAAQKHEDMSDWRNWKIGDLLEMVKAGEWEEMTNGKLYKFAVPENRDNFAVVDDCGVLRSFHIGSDDFVSGDFKFHSRPSA